MKKIKLLFPLAVLYTGLFAVINTFEDSFTRKNNIDIPFQSITMQGVDVDALIREDKENLGNGIPKRYATSFDVDLGIERLVSASIFNIKGQKVANIFEGVLNQGLTTLSWNASGFSSGIYFMNVQSNGEVISSQRISLLK